MYIKKIQNQKANNNWNSFIPLGLHQIKLTYSSLIPWKCAVLIHHTFHGYRMEEKVQKSWNAAKT